MKTVLNLSAKPSPQTIFFGDSLSLQRYDNPKYDIFLKLFKEQMGFFWRPERIDLTKDRPDFSTLTDAEQHVFVKNLQYQILLDSVIQRGIAPLVANLSLPEVEVCFSYWQFCEALHSYSYTEIIKNVFGNPAVVFDGILQDEQIVKRAESVCAEYDRLLNFVGDDKKKQVMMVLASTQALEGIRFYVSFACGFSFAEPPYAKMEGNAKILKEIARDENLHVDITRHLINILRTNPSEGFVDTWNECAPIITEMFRNATEEEKQWSTYLMSKGGVFGLSDTVLHGYSEWLCDLRLTGIGLSPIYGRKTNPIGGWLEKWLDSGKVQVAPQESEVESYRTGSMENDLNGFVFGADDF